METGCLVEDRKFRFCHLDVDVYQSAAEAVEWIWSRLVTGGLIVFDDYGLKGCEGVTRFVNLRIPSWESLKDASANGNQGHQHQRGNEYSEDDDDVRMGAALRI